MRRVVVLASLLVLLLAVLGTAAYAGCQACLEKIVADRTSTGLALRIVARSADQTFVFPESGAAVVMQIDGNRTKCLTLGLLKTTEGPGAAVYTGAFAGYFQTTQSGRVEGRVDIAGQIYEFLVPLDGSAGTLAVATDQTPLTRNRTVVQVTAAPATPAPTVAPVSPGNGILVKASELATQPAFLLGAVVVLITIAGAYVDRRRALTRSLAG
jgi:hypothetical protein